MVEQDEIALTYFYLFRKMQQAKSLLQDLVLTDDDDGFFHFCLVIKERKHQLLFFQMQ